MGWASTVPAEPLKREKLALYGAVVGVSAALGALASDPMWLVGLLGGIIAVALGIAGERALLWIVLISAGLSFNFLTESEPAVFPWATSIDGLRTAIVLAGFCVLAIRRPSVLQPLRQIRLYAAFLAIAALSIQWSPNPTDGTRLFLKLLYPALAFLLTVSIAQRKGDRPIIAMFCASALVALVVQTYVFAAGISPFAGMGGGARFAGASHPNTIGLFCAACGLVLYGSWTRSRNWLELLIGILLAVALVATGSRTALVAGGLGFVAFESLARRWRAASLALLLGLSVWLVVPTFGERTAGSGAELEVAAFGAGGGIDLSGRLGLWRDAWTSLMGDNQALGRGLGTTDLFFSGRYSSLSSVHSGYLLLLLDVGIVGLAFVLAFFCALLVGQLRVVVRRGGAGLHHSRLCVALVVSFLLASITESTFAGYSYPALLWVVIGLAVASRSHGDSAVRLA